jgi:hypothetical protein
MRAALIVVVAAVVALSLLAGGCARKQTAAPAKVDGKLPFGATCTADADCVTGHCYGGSRSFCTMPCTPETVKTDCPSPPTAGMCNRKGFCRPRE